MKHGISVFLTVTPPGNLSPMLVGYRHILQRGDPSATESPSQSQETNERPTLKRRSDATPDPDN
jgi:hypothetical protein